MCIPFGKNCKEFIIIKWLFDTERRLDGRKGYNN
jgi:hypothetical protein